MYSKTLEMSSLLMSVVGRGKGSAKLSKGRLGSMTPTPFAMITPEPSERSSQRTILPLTLYESNAPGKQYLEVKEMKLQNSL